MNKELNKVLKIDEKTETIKGIEKIESDEELTKKFRTRYATEFPMIKACIKSNMLKKEATKFIKELTKIQYIDYDNDFIN
tara:strand:- start:12 stop:251 length:240 start_codon:yes stop_codon:yes gene_type:complete